MKKRAVMIIDYDIPNGSLYDATEKYALLEKSLNNFCNMDTEIVHHSMDLKDRRGDVKTNVQDLKFRRN
jgi:hypothetical protein|tara:strand:+ start:336 stop:542 length:207 start_codon:yes stop_codon:yes gene_type:complete